MEVESPHGKKKKVWTEELFKGSEKSNGGPVVKEVGGLTFRAELKLLFWGLFTWLDCQNDLLEDLLEVKTQEVALLLSTEVNETEETDKGCHRNLTPKNQEDHIGTSSKRVS